MDSAEFMEALPDDPAELARFIEDTWPVSLSRTARYIGGQVSSPHPGILIGKGLQLGKSFSKAVSTGDEDAEAGPACSQEGGHEEGPGHQGRGSR